MTSCRRCDFRPSRDAEGSPQAQLAAHALDSGHTLCVVCFDSLTDVETQTCETCLTGFRQMLGEVVILWAELPAHVRTVSGTVSGPRGGADGPPLPGGAALALMAPGSPGGAARKLTRTDVARGLDGREHAVDNRPDDTPSVAWSLGVLEDDWRHTRGDSPAMTGTAVEAVVTGAARYLEVHARWAATSHPAFDECHADLTSLHRTLEAATHRARRPSKAGADCFDCGGDLIRRVTADGLEEDHVTCTVCMVQYEPSRYALALRQAAQAAAWIELDGEQWATPAALAGHLARPESTLRGWQRREQVRHVVYAGIVFVHVGDVTARHDERRTA